MSVGVGRGRWFSDTNQSDGNGDKVVGQGFGANKDHTANDNGYVKPNESSVDDSGWDETPSSGPTEWGGDNENKATGGGWNNGQDRGGFGNRGRGGGRGGRGGYQNRDENYGGGGRGGYHNRDENGGGGRGGYRNRDENGGGGRGGYRNRDENGGGGRGGYRNRDENESGGRGGYRGRDENDRGDSQYNRSSDGQNEHRGYRGGRGGGGDRGGRSRDDDGDTGNRGWNNRDNQQGGERSFRGRGGGYKNRDDNNGDSGDGNWNSGGGGGGGSYGSRDDGDSRDRKWGGDGGGGDDDDQGGRGYRGRGRGRGGRGRGGFHQGGEHGSEDDNRGGGFNSRNDGEGGEGEDSERPKLPHYIPAALPEDEASIFAENIPSGINFEKLKDTPVKMTGNDVPAPITSFEESGLRPLLRENIRKAKYQVPTPVQKYSIPAIMANRDLMSCAQTGSGKTAAFLLPILHNLISANLESGSFQQTQTPYCLIVAPTRELVSQIFKEAHKFSVGSCIKSVVLYGGVSTGHQLRMLEQGCHICVATPGRLMDLVEKGKLDFSKLQYLVLDEADRMLDMGFKQTIESIVGHPSIQPKEKRHTLMFSATFPEEIQNMAREFLGDYLFLAVGMVGGANSDVRQEIIRLDSSEKRDKLLEIIAGGKKILVFIEQKRQADFVSSIICQSPGLSATSIHGDRFQQQREEALEDFKTGKRHVLVATSVASRGLDIKDVEHVINFDMPKDIAEYVHRIGRTGRVGNLGRSTSFYNPETDREMARPLIKVLSDANQEVPAWLEEEAQSSYGSGGGGGYNRSRFGGSDIRSNKEIRGNSGPPEVDQWENNAAVQESESWD